MLDSYFPVQNGEGRFSAVEQECRDQFSLFAITSRIISAARFGFPFHFFEFLGACTSTGVSDGDQVIRDHAQSDPALHAFATLVATASDAVFSLEHTDPTLATHPPPLRPAKPALVLPRSARR